jgi:hypothetical protein
MISTVREWLHRVERGHSHQDFWASYVIVFRQRPHRGLAPASTGLRNAPPPSAAKKGHAFAFRIENELFFATLRATFVHVSRGGYRHDR